MTQAPTLPAHKPGENPAEPEAAEQAEGPEQPKKLPRPRVQLHDRTDGTWYWPAPFSKAALCVDFWNTVEIPEGLADQFERAYIAATEIEIAQALNAAMTPWSEAWKVADPKPKREKDQAAWLARFDAAFNERQAVVRAELAAKHPKLSFFDIPQLMRATRMLQCRPGKEYWEQGNLMFDEWIELYEETLTIQEIEDKYRLSRFWGVLDSRVIPTSIAAVVSAIEAVGGRIDDMHTELNRARGTLIDIERALEN